jgi:pyruvate/2-oxoglutarate dehydrogenase complex dihydrolipoamide acyltransferase (E2) component
VTLAATLAVGLVATAACGGDTGDSPTTPSTTTATRTVTAPAPAPTSTATETTGAPAAAPPATSQEAGSGGGGVMPAVVCMNLQAAQDLIQQQGVFLSRSHDATGQGRRQVLDRNWIVVEQSPAPGTPISEGDADLGAVKIGEPSPC